jgi:hypothetical protein
VRISRLLGAGGRAQARRAVEARVLPRELARFYRRALAEAVSARDTPTLAAIPEPRELLALLEVTRGCEHVIELGRDDPITPVALAIDDARRQVTAYRPAGGARADRYAALADPSTRARIDFRTRPLEHSPLAEDASACATVIDGASDSRTVRAAFQTAREAVRPEGLIVLRRHRDPAYGGVGAAVAELGLDGHSLPDHLYVWRKPVEAPPPPVAPKPARSRRVPWSAAALALVGIALGVGAGALLTGGGGDDSTNASTTVPAPPAQQQQQSAPPAGTTRSAERRARSRRRQAQRQRQRQRRRARRTQGAGGVPDIPSQFSGTGSRTLDRVVVRRDSVLRWTVQGGKLELKSKSFQMSATAHSGQTTIPRGVYRSLRVTSSTAWTLEIVRP